MNLLNFITLTDSDYRLLFSISSALFGAIVGGGITIWYKKKEVKNLSDNLNLQSQNLNLQKQVFEEASRNNELKMKAELVRLEDLNRQYKLNLEKYDFEHLSKVIDFAGDSNEKIKMLKKFSLIIENYKFENYFFDAAEYDEKAIDHTYYKLGYIETNINELLKDFPNVFNSLHSDFEKVKNNSNYLISTKGELSYHEEISDEQIMDKMSSSLLQLHTDFLDLLNKMKQEFLELDTIKKNYISSQFKNRIQE
ncbi:aldo/keto reductase [Polaribacter sp. MSW13]|uniref:Aldo/keto reductase n=1 Tax=Polaribacter marinus TaxID=2916838 RepID=A0A9X2ANY2_9FLAO|nr:aldo/keto reductase [Polaribacter marinus]MCI2230399.1 aldo/keto reductase [Polaribacter marinus]